MARVIYKNVLKKFDKKTAVDNLNLEIEDGEFLVLLGPSGCGKTTALRMIAGLEEPTEGDIYIGDQSIVGINPSKRNVAMVFQNYALYPHMSIFGNINFPLLMRGVKKEEREKKSLEVAKLLNIEPLLDKRPSQLSGGEQQRVALARAIVREPVVFLLDEPLSNLDAKLRVKMRFELRKLLKDELATTTVYVTHDQVEAMTMADKIAIMNEGTLQQVGKPTDIFDKPVNVFVASFIGNPPMNIVEGNLLERNGSVFVDIDLYTLSLPPMAQKLTSRFKRIIVGFRPQHVDVEIKKHDSYIEGKLLGIEKLGTEMYGYLAYNDQQIIIALPTEIPLTDSDTIYWSPRLDKMYFFDPETEMTIDINGPIQDS
ncbi:MAG: Trehalose/maltose import ATP-binding protein MalK [Candidatus Heimdallarchaeota archaeon LC_3]|nr:MAG: Trehalose/maltose import ATP-binding protein MalK [Candidatus Heimdallarchaeota archaeon LC_3]